MKRIACAILMIAILVFPAQAGLFDFWKPKQVTSYSQPLRSQALSEIDFRLQLQALNTPQAIQTLNKVMDDYKTTVVKVRVYRLPWQTCEYCGINFYVVKGVGVVENYQTNDKEVSVTYQQVQRLIPLIQDGKIDWFETLQARMILL